MLSLRWTLETATVRNPRVIIIHGGLGHVSEAFILITIPVGLRAMLQTLQFRGQFTDHYAILLQVTSHDDVVVHGLRAVPRVHIQATLLIHVEVATISRGGSFAEVVTII